MKNVMTVGVSVVVPMYNAEKTISRAIESVLGQTYKNLELILIDDGSKDRCLLVAQKYAADDPRISVFRNPDNMGVSCARNYGVRKAKYEWVAFLDSDDYWETDKLEKQLKIVQEHTEAVLCYTGCAYIDEKGNQSDYVLHVPTEVTFGDLLKQNVISCSSVLVRKERLQHNPMLDDKRIHEDYALWLKLLQEGTCAIGIDEPLLIYQISEGSKSGNKFASAQMQWNTYRKLGIPALHRIGYFLCYATRNMHKYRKIKRGYNRAKASGRENAVL